MQMAADGFARRGLATAHDLVVAGALADVLSGGDTDIMDTVNEHRCWRSGTQDLHAARPASERRWRASSIRSKPANRCATESRMQMPCRPTRHRCATCVSCCTNCYDSAGLGQLPGHEDVTPDLIDSVLEEAAKLVRRACCCRSTARGDEEGCTLENGVVRTPRGFKEAYDDVPRRRLDRGRLRSGLRRPGPAASREHAGGGDDLLAPTSPSPCIPGLSHGAYEALAQHGSDELKQLYLPKLTDGTWSGTMCLTEPHCGTDLGMLRTRPSRRPTAATGSPAPRSSSRPASTTSPRTSSISCWRACRTRRPAPRDQPVPGAEVPARRRTARRASATASSAAHRAQDGHQGARHLPCSTSTARRAGWSASRTRACARCSR